MLGDHDAPTDPNCSIDEPAAPPGVAPSDEIGTHRRGGHRRRAGEDRIVAEVTGGHATLRLLVAGGVAGAETMVDISAGDDPEFGPSIGVHLCAGGDEMAVFSLWREGAGPWRAAGPARPSTPPWPRPADRSGTSPPTSLRPAPGAGATSLRPAGWRPDTEAVGTGSKIDDPGRRIMMGPALRAPAPTVPRCRHGVASLRWAEEREPP